MAKFCAGCDDQLPSDGDFVTCRAGCMKQYHIQCTTLSAQSYARMPEKKRAAWFCTNCREDKKRKVVRGSLDRREANRNTEDQEKPEDVNTLLKQLNINMKKITEEMEEIKTSLQFHTEQYDVILEELKGLREIKSRQKIVEDRVNILEDRVNELEQYSRCRNLEIKGVEENVNENLKQIVVKIAKKVGVSEIKESDIDIIHRVGNMAKRTPKDIIVQFKDREHRNKLLGKKKEKIISKEVTEGRNDNIVYVNEHLTTFNKNLLWQVKTKCKEHNYKFVWIKEGKIFVRKKENGNALRIKSESDLVKIE